MMGRSDIWRAAAMIAVVGLFMVILHVINRNPAPAPRFDSATVPAPDDLFAEMRRCRALGQQDAEDPHCQTIWEENRRRFFGRPARPLPPSAAPATTTPPINKDATGPNASLPASPEGSRP